jgi:hypothetical protein
MHIAWVAIASAAWILVACQPIDRAAEEWSHVDVIDHLRGTIGKGVSFEGSIEDRGKKQSGWLVVHCAGNSTTVLLETRNIYYGGGNRLKVQYALDGASVQTTWWDICESGDCIGLWGGSGIPFVKQLFNKTELRLTVSRSFGGPIHGVFRVEGAVAALHDVGRACNWLPKVA